MTSARQNLNMHSGDDKVITVTVTDANTAAAKDITGATINWAMAKSPGATAALSKATGGSGITITDATNGIFTIALDPADTDSLAGDYYHEAQVTDGSGNISTVLVGTIKIARDLINP